jgi:Ser/Thr protein kinase RdoA (MazF antagonist)
MIPLPPRDPALPALGVALDGAAMSEILARRLADAEGMLAVESCRPCYVRYKPGTSCLVQYELTVHDGSRPRRVVTHAHITMYPGDYARRVGSRQKVARLAEDTARRYPELPGVFCTHLPELQAVLQRFPMDRKLPALLQAASAVEMSRRLGEVGLAADGLEEGSVELVRYKPGRKALFRYPPSGPRSAAAYGKLHGDDRGALVFQLGRALLDAGVATARPLTYLSDLWLVVHAEAPGHRLRDLRGSRAFGGWMEEVAEALSRLHWTRDHRLGRHSLKDESNTVVAAGLAIGTLLPDLTNEATRLARRLAARLDEVAEADVTVHGDFSDDQVIVSDRGAVLLDFDEARQSHPLVDVGMFVAELSVRADGSADASEAARAAFLDAYAACRPELRRELALFEAAALLKKSIDFFRRLERDWPAEAERLVGLAALRLDEYERDRTRRPSAWAASPYPVDPALPQLEVLVDPLVISVALGRSVFAEATVVTEVAILRHKPGRRCTLRYDVRVGSPGTERLERLYAKTFASGRGHRVYEVLTAISGARTCGPGVRVPAPLRYLPFLKLLVLREVPGAPVAPALLAGDTAMAERIADAIHALHASGLDLRRQHGPEAELAPLGDRVRRLCGACPSLAPLAIPCLRLVDAWRERAFPWRWRPAHRDFYHDQILAGDHGLSVLDFDDAAMAEPALDIANFLGHLTLLALQHPDRADAVSAVRAAFAARSRFQDPELDLESLSFLEGATLLRLAEIHLSRDRGEVVAAGLLHASGELLEPASSRRLATAKGMMA